MPTLLLQCLDGFLDSEEGLPVPKDKLREIGEFRARRMSHKRIVNAIREIAPDAYYHRYRGQVKIFEYVPEG